MQLSVRHCAAAGLVLAALLLLSACGSSSIYSPVSERSIGARTTPRIVRSSQSLPSAYVVRKGDTLYSIAFRYGLDYGQLARYNRIDNSYSIYPGQTLRLAAATSGASRPASPAKPAAASSRGGNQTAVKPVTKKTHKPVNVAVTAAKDSTTTGHVRLAWKWPSSGRVLQGYSSGGKVNKGINLAGSKGDPVYAAESGRVVYAGSGLLGYGNLVIINHNQQYLSAYAHNSRILVKENDMVKLGAKIAEIGSSGATRDMLHFEIRRDGRPVDPMKYLPRKR